MGDIVNLQQYRKKLKRERGERRAMENRAQFGRSKLDRRNADGSRQRHDKDLDGKRLLRKDDDENPNDRHR